jgi:2,4-dienoyl-CoA reductase-like NADH-dependent reductase (Old Yellow Enzyme family)
MSKHFTPTGIGPYTINHRVVLAPLMLQAGDADYRLHREGASS